MLLVINRGELCAGAHTDEIVHPLPGTASECPDPGARYQADFAQDFLKELILLTLSKALSSSLPLLIPLSFFYMMKSKNHSLVWSLIFLTISLFLHLHILQFFE